MVALSTADNIVYKVNSHHFFKFLLSLFILLFKASIKFKTESAGRLFPIKTTESTCLHL